MGTSKGELRFRPKSTCCGRLLCIAAVLAIRAQDELQLFHKMQTALGGIDKIASIRDFEECVHAQTGASCPA